MSRIVFLDTETTSLRADRRVWEIGYIIRDEGDEKLWPAGDYEEHAFVDIDDLDLGNADLMSLKIGRFHERHPQAASEGYAVSTRVRSLDDVCRRFEFHTRGAQIVGAVPWFDTEVLGLSMREYSMTPRLPSWHYHLIDVEALACGAIGLPINEVKFDVLLDHLGLSPSSDEDRHTALGDARLVRDLYDKVLGRNAHASVVVRPNLSGDAIYAASQAYASSSYGGYESMADAINAALDVIYGRALDSGTQAVS